MNEETKGNEGRDVRGDEETRTLTDHPIASVGRKAMGSVPKSTVGWGAVVTILSALLYFSSQVDSKIDGRVDQKLNIVKAVYDKQFEFMGKELDECKQAIQNIRDEKKSYNPDKPTHFDYRGRR